MNNKNAQIDTEIVHRLIKIPALWVKDGVIITKTFDEVCADIANKRNTAWCGAYELIKHDNQKEECFIVPKSKSLKILEDDNQPQDAEKKTKGKLRSIDQNIEKNRKLDKQLLHKDELTNKSQKKLKNLRNNCTMTSAHL